MEDKICIDDIYVGFVVKVEEYDQENGELVVKSYNKLRSVLFTVDDENLSCDLLYEMPKNYPILGITSDEICLSNDIVIVEPQNLGELLRYLEYEDYLSHYGIVKMQDEIFDINYILRNKRKFDTNLHLDRHVMLVPRGNDYFHILFNYIGDFSSYEFDYDSDGYDGIIRVDVFKPSIDVEGNYEVREDLRSYHRYKAKQLEKIRMCSYYP